MKIVVGQRECDFDAWRPELGHVFENYFAFDCETAAIDLEREWLTPPYVLGAAYDGHNGFFVRRQDVAAFFQQHADLHMVLHHAPFDLAVIHQLAPELDIYRWVDRDQVHDTQLYHRLLKLAEEGHTARGSGQSTLETCASEYLGVNLPKQLVDSVGDDVRVSYGKWLQRPSESIEPIYLEYLAKDCVVTFDLCCELINRLNEVLDRSRGTWGYVDPDWLDKQIDRWGYQTHHIQLKAAVVLHAIKANGLHIDVERLEQLTADLGQIAEKYRRKLRGYGYLPGEPGAGKALQGILRGIDRQRRAGALRRTPEGRYETTHEALQELADTEPFVRSLLTFWAVEKLLSAFLTKMNHGRLHPSFNPLMVTGRTSSYGVINAQNIPRDDRVRSCFIPAPGHVFLVADYSMIELVTLAQSVQSQFGSPSRMAQAINQGYDLHQLVAAHLTGKPLSDVTPAERNKAKPINFGTPGGMGKEGLRSYAKISYGVDLTAHEVNHFSETWFDLFPEMRDFLEHDGSHGMDFARYFQLSADTYLEVTGSRQWLRWEESENQTPNEILGWMCKKVLQQANPQQQNGVPYSAELIDFCWQRVKEKCAEFNVADQADIYARRPSIRLALAALQIAQRKPCFTLTGRLRANATFCARHNTVFQGLAADGAKLALWRLWREGYRLVNFIHDEVLIEVPADSDLTDHAARVKQIMIDAMREVVPDVKIDVTCCAIDRWYKGATATYDPIDGRLLIWTPAEPSSQVASLD